MTEHKDIQNPEDFSESKYQEFRYKLTDEFTSAEELKEICMTLAHLPTKEAQDLLDEFKHSDRAKEVEWLECAIDEGSFWLLSPGNEQEERDFLAVKMIGEIDDHVVEIMGKIDVYKLEIDKYNIRVEALKMIPENEIETKYDISALQNLIQMNEGKIEKLQREILLEEKVHQKIRALIKTERYKKLDPMDISDIHLNGETF